MWFRDVDVPAELVQAARAGELVVFVGAGASRDAPSDLPDFRNLVIEVGTRTGSVPEDNDLDQPDVFLGRLAHNGVDVHGIVARALDKPAGEPNRLHRAIIELARVHPPVRVVTTNYDPHLSTAASDAVMDMEVFRGPALPVGDDFTGLVHLHGALDQDASRLVVTDADFGHAYLREAWASRFLERMFSRFTVLFIGYSHGDLVMRYLARSLGPDGRRFVLTDHSDNPDWNRLGLVPVSYPVREGSHAALADALERWAERAAWGRLGHRRSIAQIISAGPPPTIPDEMSYLEEALGHPERVRYFVEHARGHGWLTWVAERPEFERLFTHPAKGQPDDLQVARELTLWLADNFVMVPEESPAALRLLRDRVWTPATWSTLAHRLFAQDARVPDWQVPWLLLVLHQAPPGPDDILDMLLCKKSWSERPDLALMLLEHRTRPIPVSGFDLGEVTDPPSFDVRIVGDEHWLTEAWTTVFCPLLDTHAETLLALAVRQLRAAYQIATCLRPGFDSLNFGRSAIEPHEQDSMRESHDVLIDAARDSLERLLLMNQAAAARNIDALASASEALLRRLAVHGWRLRTDLDADAQLTWLLDQGLLYDFDVQHEVFKLLEAATPSAGPDTIAALLSAVAAGPPAHDDEPPPSPYVRYNLLVWLSTVAPEVQPIAAAAAEARTAHPEYAPRPHPDLHSHMTVGSVEDAEPFTVDELHAMIESDPAVALAHLRAHHTTTELALTGPTWTGALRSVHACVSQHPHDGLILARTLNSVEPAETAGDKDHGDPADGSEGGEEGGAYKYDVRRRLIDAWGDASLDDDLRQEVIATIWHWDIEETRSAAARLLAHGGTAEHPTAWHVIPDARALALHLWPTHEVAGNILSSEDALLEALNHPAGDLAQFWTRSVAHDWADDRDNWRGLTAQLAQPLDQMVADPGRNGRLARTILARQLRFYFRADNAWTRTNLLPLFDWAAADPGDVRAAWQTFLRQGQFDDGLLGAGLFDYYLETLRHTETLGARTTARLGGHLAAIALFAATDPASWLPTLVTDAPEEVQLAWVRGVARSLRDMDPGESDQQWTRWISDYWADRTESIPRPLSHKEASNMTLWVIAVPTRRSEAVALLERTPAGLPGHDRLLLEMAEMNLKDDPLTWTRLLTHVLRNTTDTSWSIGYYLKDIVQSLRAADPAPDLGALIEEAMRLGCADAPDW